MPQNPDSGQDSNTAQLPQPLRQAVAAHQAGQLDVAYPLYRRFVDQNPEHPTALQLLGLLHSQRGEYQSAIAMMRESLRLFPPQAEVANNLGNALVRTGELEEAIESYTEAIRIFPRYPDALRNLGLAFLKTLRFDEAGDCFKRCLDINPDDAATWLGLGDVHKQQDDFGAAIPCFDKALELQPDYAEAHHNLGVCLRLQKQPQAALKHYEEARRLGLDRPELYHNLGNALIDIQDARGAIDAYRTAVEQNPGDLESHRNLNSLLWQQDLTDDYLKSYQHALDKQPGAVPLRQAYGMALIQLEAFEDAERVLEQGLRHAPDASGLKSLLALTMEGQERWNDALQLHLATINTPGSIPNHRINYARALLACKRPDEALAQAELGTVQIPFNQQALAYLGLCWRMLGDERDEILNDYENFVRVFDIPVPSQFANTEEFNARLSTVLEPLHIGKRHPPEQTLRGGSQTSGDLFDRHEAEIGDLIAGLKQCIQDYIAHFPRDPEHPLLLRRSENFDFSASWSVRLARCGFHTMHVHPMGWISSAYYVQVPPEVAASDAHGGGLKFGEPDIDLGEQGAARRQIQPAVGRLVLFPSYMWHGTVPFESDDPRMSVAFDVVPIQT